MVCFSEKIGKVPDIYKSLLWDLLQDGIKNKFNDNQFNEMINNNYIKQAYILLYNEYLYDISEENINRKKRLAEVDKKEIIDKYFDRYFAGYLKFSINFFPYFLTFFPEP